MKRSGRIKPKRKSGIKVGKHTGKIRLYGAKLMELREKVYDRSMGVCELKLKGCEWYAGWKSGELHHKVHRSLGGSDTIDNCLFVCKSCHRKEHSQ